LTNCDEIATPETAEEFDISAKPTTKRNHRDTLATCRRGDRSTKLNYGPICCKLLTNWEEIARDA
jgi:hypothetical protein